MKNNPYVGPRPYERGDRLNFYGRNREARDLLSLIMAERAVLFYAPSGAGKTSLLNAQIIPALEEEGFTVCPGVRVGGDLPPGVAPKTVKNIFVFNVLAGLAGRGTPYPSLAGQTLLSFFSHLQATRSELEERPPILILDQFEEILTTHRDRWQDTRDFFEQLREALSQMPSLGVVMSMREDYAAALDAYSSLLPRRLRARFRMEQLGQEGALEAVAKPAARAGCPFAPGVAERLVDNLRQIKVQQLPIPPAEGEPGPVLGPFVEPVQLQVVCNRLWENLPDQIGQESCLIEWEEVERYGNIDRALIDFYESALTDAIEKTGVNERVLRRWFGQQMITPIGTRGIALQERGETAGLPNAAVAVFEAHHLIRADVRAGARWYELSHDRLVEPIQSSNRAWQEMHQQPLTVAAQTWQMFGKDPHRLLRGVQLVEAQAQLESDAEMLTELEREFVHVSAETFRRETAKRQRLTWLFITSLLVIFTALTSWAVYSAVQANAARKQAEAESAISRSYAGTAQAERNIAMTMRAELAANLEGNLTAQAQAAYVSPTFTPVPTRKAPGASPTATPTGPQKSPSPTPSPFPTVTPDYQAQTQLSDLRATQTAVAEHAPPFIYGVVVSLAGAKGDFLLNDPYDEKSGIIWVPVGTNVMLLQRGEGAPAYGSGVWYLVSLVNPETNQIVQGWLPAEIVAEAALAQ